MISIKAVNLVTGQEKTFGPFEAVELTYNDTLYAGSFVNNMTTLGEDAFLAKFDDVVEDRWFFMGGFVATRLMMMEAK